MTYYAYKSLKLSSPNEVVVEMDDFLVNDIGGWTRHFTVSDTTANRDYVWSSPGESVDRDTIYIRARWQNSIVYFYGYTSFTDASTHTGALYHSTYTRCPVTTGAAWCWMMGNKDFVNLFVMDGAVIYQNYLGFIHSYYLPETDPCPLLIKGQYNTTSYWTTAPRQLMHSGHDGSAQYVRIWINYSHFYEWDSGLDSERVLLLPVILHNYTNPHREVRGEPFGVFIGNGDRLSRRGIVQHGGNHYLSLFSGESYVYGPISSDVTHLFKECLHLPS